jgi:hypothetical protein
MAKMAFPKLNQRLRTFFLGFLGLLMAGCAAPPAAPNSQAVRIGASVIRLEMPADLPLPKAAVVAWVRRAAEAVTTYLGHFPAKHLTVTVRVGGDEPVGDGVTYGVSRIVVRLGRSVRASDLNGDWVLTHEMFHLAFPTLKHRYLWMMEGLSDYLEPIARAQAGQWSARDAWREFLEGFPQGLPEPGDGGLDNSFRRERIYWGGNIYWLLVDLSIREQTNNRRSLQDAIRAILAEGGNGGVDWPLERVLTVGDEATGTTALKDWYEQLGPKPGHVDLAAIWKKLGVREAGDAIDFNDQAPWAKFRAAITAPAPGVRQRDFSN